MTAVATMSFTTATMAQNVPNYVPTNGLVGWWPFNGNANDESGNGNNGTVNGATLTIDRFGNASKAYNFDGVSSYIAMPQITNQNINEFSISMWYFNQTPPGNLCYTYYHGATTGEWHLNDSAMSVKLANDTWYWVPFTRIFSNWTNIVGVYSRGNNIKVYINGQYISEKAIPNLDLWTTNTLSSVGAYARNQYFSPCSWKGKIDDIGIWNRALTQQEITNLYNALDCNYNLSISPTNNILPSGGTATFTTSSNAPNPSYIWQSDFGQGFQTLNNFGNYSGTNTTTLSIANVQLSNHQQPIRAISTSGNCIDTSAIATISISDTCITSVSDTTYIMVTDTLIINTTLSGINPPNNSNTIKVFPNPANDHITINYGNYVIMSGYQLKIENSLGQQVFQTNISQQSDYLQLSNWGGNGLYFVHIIDPQGNTIDIRKIVIQ